MSTRFSNIRARPRKVSSLTSLWVLSSLYLSVSMKSPSPYAPGP